MNYKEAIYECLKGGLIRCRGWERGRVLFWDRDGLNEQIGFKSSVIDIEKYSKNQEWELRGAVKKKKKKITFYEYARSSCYGGMSLIYKDTIPADFESNPNTAYKFTGNTKDVEV